MTITVTDRGYTRHILIDRPERMNAVDSATLDLLAARVIAAGADPAVRVIVLSGAGRAFCAGGDLDVENPLSVENTATTCDAAAHCIEAIRRVPRPVVASVRGPAVGVGVSIALAADLTLARTDAFFAMPFTSIGLMPDGGATALVAASVGRATAMRMSMLGERIGASEALAIGLVAAVYDEEDFERELDAVISRLALVSIEALVETKIAVNEATLVELANAFARERDGQIRLTAGAGFRDAVAAFANARAARRVPSEDLQ
ncbi:enoyl-CoA hydratase-related protein [Williamsia sp.]|uniref:enoyl-CoA hydratase-related protein n=1 Tax=Williamsia sp. TaxID=1872085 RepID=UPI002F91C63E